MTITRGESQMPAAHTSCQRHARRPNARRLAPVLLSLASLLAPFTTGAHAAPMPQTNTRPAAPPRDAAPEDLARLRAYIKDGWRTLTRSSRDLARAAADPKFERAGAPARRIVYVPLSENIGRLEARLRAELAPADFAQIRLVALPADQAQITEPGLLYLPHPYVVPGGRFNEMYGWDSYFHVVGCLRDDQIALAKDMADNHLYQVKNYGAVLNANRSYYLTRSQPPFLARMVLDVYRRTKDQAWLRSAVPAIEKYYQFWTTAPHVVDDAGLARYFDRGEGPAAEVVADERDAAGRTHYDRVREFYRTEEVIQDYDITKFYDRKQDELLPAFYKGDRSMRESGFDPSNRFGWFSTDITSYFPVCLNSLLYAYERDTAEIMRIVGRAQDARRYDERAARRGEQINRLLWHDGEGLYYDLNFETRTQRRYPFATTFYPLWAGLASPEQARRVVANLRLFEQPGGLQTSTNRSGSQWDAPYGWAPLQLLACEGLRRYGYSKEADRISAAFLSTVLKEFMEHDVVVEKYDVARRESDTAGGVRFGYDYNVVGFGWTNAAFVELYARLPPAARAAVLDTDRAATR